MLWFDHERFDYRFRYRLLEGAKECNAQVKHDDLKEAAARYQACLAAARGFIDRHRERLTAAVDSSLSDAPKDGSAGMHQQTLGV